MLTLPMSELQEILRDDESSQYELVDVTSDRDNEHRWFYTELMVFKSLADGKLYGASINIPKSESQEGQDYFDTTQECWEVEKKEITITKEIWSAK
jgi:hypothetical protein